MNEMRVGADEGSAAAAGGASRVGGGRGPWRRRPKAWVIPFLAAFVALVVWAVGTTTGIELVVRAGEGTRVVGAVDVVATAFVVGLLGWGVRALIRRLTGGGGDRAWLVLCAVVLAVSLLGPFGVARLEVAGLLVAQHVAVGAAVALGLSDRRRGFRRTAAVRGA